MANDSGDGKYPTGTEAVDSPGEEGQLCSVALKDIFLSCDKHNVGSAHAQSLIEFVTPFLSNNDMELMCLKNCLDPNSDNPLITEEQFFHKMQMWISKIKTISVSPEKKGNFEVVSFHQFSSNENGPSNQLLKNSAESGLLNVSSTSSSSLGNALQEIACLQEATHELDYQNRKLQEELALIKSQLTASEEQNELLQSDLRKINNKLLAEQHLNQQLHLERKENEELRECSQGLTKKIELLEKSFSSVEKENGNIRQKLELLEQENQKLEDKLEQARNKELEKEKSIIKMRTEYDYKEAIITSLEKAVLEMQEKLKDNQQIIEHHVEINEGLKMEKITLEKLLRGQLSQTYIIPSTLPNPLTSGSSGTNSNDTPNTYHHIIHQKQQSNRFPNFFQPDSPITAIIQHEVKIFNSPKLKGMLENPVSPNLSKTASQINKSLDSNDSTSFERNVEGSDTVKNDQISFHPSPKQGESAFFKKYRLVGEPEPALTTPLPQNLDKLRQPKCKDAELKATTGGSPMKNNSTTSIFLHDTSSEDDLFSKIPLTESTMATHHSLLYELSQVNKENEVNNNSKNILDQMQQENDDLKMRLDVCTEELEELKNQLELVKINETETKKENTNLRNEVKLLIQEKLDLKCLSENSSSYILELQDKLKNVIKHEEMLIVEIKEITEQKNILNQTISDMEKKNKNLITELNKLNQSLQLKECATENLEHEHLNLLDSFDNVKKEYDELKKISNKEICERRFAEKLSEAMREKENYIKILKTEVEIVNCKLNETSKISEENRDVFSEEIARLTTAIAKKEETISELKRHIHNLSMQLDDHNLIKKQTEKMQSEKIREYNKLIEEKEARIKCLEKDIELLNTQINKFENVKVNDQLIEQLQKELDHTKEIQSELERQITQKNANEENLKTEINKLKKFLEDNEKSITYLTTFSNHLNQQISIKGDIEMILRREVNKFDQILNEKEETIKHLENEISQIKQLLSVKDALVDQLKNCNSNKIVIELEGVIKEKDGNIEDLEKKVQDLNKLNEEKDIQLNDLYSKIEQYQMHFEKKDQSLCEHLDEIILLEKKKGSELEENIGDLMKTVKNKNDTIQNFQVLVSDLQTKLKDANCSFEETEKIHEIDILQLKADIEKKEDVIKDLELSLRQQEMLNDQLNENIILEGTKFGKLQDEINQLRADIFDREEKDKKFKHDFDFLKSELEEKEKLIQKFEDNDQTLTSKLELTRKVLHEKEDYIQQLNNLNSDLTERVSIINNSMNNIEDHNKELNKQLTEKEDTINSLKCSIDALNMQIVTMKSQTYTNKVMFETQIKSLQQELKNREKTTEKLRNELSSKIKFFKDESHSLNSVLKLQKTSLENYEVQVCEMNKTIEAKNSHLDSLSHDLNQLKETSKERDVIFAYLQKDFKELENRYQQKITEVEELTTLLITKERNIEKLKEKNHQFHISLKENEEIVRRLETETGQLNEQLTILSKVHSDTQEYKSPKSGRCSYDRLNIKIEKLQEKNDFLEQQLEEEKNHIKEVLNENSELSKEICKLHEMNLDLKKELEQLKNESKDDALFTKSTDSPSGDVTNICLTSQQTVYQRTTNIIPSNKENEIDQNISEVILSLKNALPMLSLYRQKTTTEKLLAREKFETLVLALTVDASTIMDRVERQKGRLLAMEDSVATEVAKLLDLLDEVKSQNEDPFVANRIVLCIEQVSVVTDVASNTVITAMRAGSLQQEQNFIHSMCTLINYVSDVQRDLDSASSQLGSLSKRQSSFARLLIERCPRMFNSSVFRIFYRLCAAAIFIYVVTVIIATCIRDDDFCSPFIKINYGHGPRPI